MFSRSDSFVDLSLRILTAVIVAVLLLALGLLAWNFLTPRRPEAMPVPLVDLAPKPAQQSEPAAAPVPTKGEVLLDPGRVYRCVIKGRTTFSERPCPDGSTAEPTARR